MIKKFRRVLVKMNSELKRDDTLSIEITKRKEERERGGENKLITTQNNINNKSTLIPKLISFVQNFVMQSRIQAQIISEISSIIDDPFILIKFRPSISAVQLRLLFEIIIGCGIELVHIREGEEVIIVWNNNSNNNNNDDNKNSNNNNNSIEIGNNIKIDSNNNIKIDNSIEIVNNINNNNKSEIKNKIQNLRLTYIVTGVTSKTREIINEEVPHFKSIQRKKFGKNNYASLQYDNLLTWEILK
jgi:hypothetical protein